MGLPAADAQLVAETQVTKWEEELGLEKGCGVPCSARSGAGRKLGGVGGSAGDSVSRFTKRRGCEPRRITAQVFVRKPD